MNTLGSRRFLRPAAFALATLLAAAFAAHGQGVPGYPDDVRKGYDPREVALLPRYCIYTQLFREAVPGGNDPEEIKRWTALMGPAFIHMHHYCWGLMKTNRALLLVRTEQFRNYYLRDSLQEFDYVINRAPADFRMLPEIHTRKAENLVRLGRAKEGMQEFERAIALKPDYWPPYAGISDYYRGTGDRAKARQWLEAGLAYSPGVNALQRRLAEIGGAQPGNAAQAGSQPIEQTPPAGR